MIEGQFRPHGAHTQFGGAIQPVWNPWHRRSLKEILSGMGLLDNLAVCLDAGDSASLPASSTKWLDTSGNGYDFDRGTTSSGESSDPTINGTPNGRSSAEYLSFDGADRLQYDSANETWMSQMHYSTARWSYVGWVYTGGFLGDTIRAQLFGTAQHASTTQRGASFAVYGTDVAGPNENFPAMYLGNATATPPINSFMALTGNGFVFNSWNFAAISMDSNLSTSGTDEWCKCTINANQRARTTARSAAHSDSAATSTLELSGPVSFLPSGYRLGMCAFWSGKFMSFEEQAAIFNTTRRRYGV